MIKVGITGPIGSGKSTVCKLWQQKGAYIVNADNLAKDIMVTDLKLIQRLKHEFGDDFYTPDGFLNKSYIVHATFGSGKIETLNKIVHPFVFQLTKQLMREAEKNNMPVFVKDAALLLNYGRPDDLDYIVLVNSDVHIRLKRVKERNAWSDKDFFLRDSAQANFTSLLEFIDFVLENDGTLSELEDKSNILYNTILSTGKR